METLNIAVSARALFDMEESNQIFLTEGAEAFIAHCIANEEVPLAPGVAFPLVRGLLNLNRLSGEQIVEVVVVSSIAPEAGIRVLNSIAHHDLPTLRSSFTGSAPSVDYLEALGVDLLLSKSHEDAQAAIQRGIAAAIMYALPKFEDLDDDPQIRFAFDGDAVLFSNESEIIYQQQSLKGFLENETRNVDVPLADGPFAKVLRTINKLQKIKINGRKLIRVALVTARGGVARLRVLKTFAVKGVTVDEAHFLNGMKKAGILKAFKPHIFFDDQQVHVEPASEVVPSGLVPWAKTDADGETASVQAVAAE